MLTLEKKEKMIASLKQDYVVMTDIVVEVVADTKADMFMLKKEQRAPTELEYDKKALLALDKEYDLFYKADPKKAVDIIEKIYEISEKYDSLRMGK